MGMDYLFANRILDQSISYERKNNQYIYYRVEPQNDTPPLCVEGVDVVCGGVYIYCVIAIESDLV